MIGTGFPNLMRPIIRIFLIVWLLVGSVIAQQSAKGSFQGRIFDSLGGLLGGVDIVLIDSAGAERRSRTNGQGSLTIDGLVPGKYTVRAGSAGFAAYENTGVEIFPGKTASLDITLEITVTENVNVGDERMLGTDPDSNAGATVLKEKDIEALPDDATELEAALRALAGPGAGPNGGEIFVDGFSGAKLPPRDTIKEVRLNQNPFSSEYDRMGLGRIEIITKPGTEKFRGEFETQFEDESLNSRNPYATNRPPFQLRFFEGNLSGPIVRDRASFFVDAEHHATDNNSLINAQLLDPALHAISLRQAVVTPTIGIEIEPRVDIKINEKNSLTVRYGYARDTQDNSGLGGFDLPSRAYNNISSDHTVRFTEAAVLSPTMVNEARFQFVTVQSRQDGDTGTPTIRVNDAFISGGANIGAAGNRERRFELQDYVSKLFPKHTLKAGGRIRNVKVTDIAPTNFAGTFTFSTLDQYRNTVLNLPGAYPTQFSIAGGDPEASVKVTDWGVFAQDDWRVHPRVTLSFGLRYERQTGVSDNSNIAPRFSFAYAPGAGAKKGPKTVIRGGFGIFYDRFSRNLILQTNRYDGVNQQLFVVTAPAILDPVIFTSAGGVSNVPTAAALAAFAQPQTTRVTAPDLNIPRTFQTALSIERQLPYKTTVSLSYVNTVIQNLLRSRNINAPVGGVRPNPAAGNIFQYESTGRYNQNQLIVNFRSNFSEKVSIFGNYSFSGARSDSEGAGTFPADSYDLADEYGNSSQDIRHRLTMGGNYSAPLGLRFSPFVTYRSGIPFNITTGADSNGDTLFTERPSFAANLSEPGIVVTRFGAFDPTPGPGDTIIPRNFGRGSSYLSVNLTAAKELGFGPSKKGDDERPYKLEFSVQARNLFNWTNKGTPVGNLSSSFFGLPTSVAGNFGGGGGSSTANNRRIRLAVQFSF
jgi:Carboxypeptidase regulatory-like domain/TonB dependent receptor